jgi:rubrerythrin
MRGTKGENDMSVALSAADLFSAAILLEEKGARFYSEAAARFSGEGKKLLSGLASMERVHAGRFRKVLEGLPQSGEMTEEKEYYLRMLTGDRIFTPEAEMEKRDDYGGILEKAITVEKNSVFFYTAVKDTLAQKMDGTAVDLLIREEIGHFQSLTDALQRWLERKGEA